MKVPAREAVVLLSGRARSTRINRRRGSAHCAFDSPFSGTGVIVAVGFEVRADMVVVLLFWRRDSGILEQLLAMWPDPPQYIQSRFWRLWCNKPVTSFPRFPLDYSSYFFFLIFSFSHYFIINFSFQEKLSWTPFSILYSFLVLLHYAN